MILTENLLPSKANLITLNETDATSGKKKLFMSGTFIEGGVKNHNERIYPVSEIRKAVDHINDQIKNKISITGEIDHPTELTINLDRISHVITEMWMEGNVGMGKLRILGTPSGNIIRTLIEEEIHLGVSSRGVGNVDDRGNVSSFEIITVDIVMRPSAPNAYPTPVFESFNSRRGRVISDLAQAVSHDPQAQKYLTKELLAWINKL